MEAIIYGDDQGAEERGVIGVMNNQFIAVSKAKPFFMDLTNRDSIVEDGKIHAKQIAFHSVIPVLTLNGKAGLKK